MFWIGILLYVVVALPLIFILAAAIKRGMHRDEDNDFDESIVDPSWEWPYETKVRKETYVEEDYVIGDDDSDWGDKS